MSINIAYVCGGTGGHVYPAVAMAQYMSNTKSFFIVNTHRQSENILTSLRFNVTTFPCTIKQPFQILLTFIKTLWFLKKNHIKIVIGTGGFITSIILTAAKCLQIPIIVLEQNVIPGKATRLLQHLTKHICISFPESKNYLNKKKCILTGNPVRFPEPSKPPSFCTSSSNIKCLIFGGSQGAQAINEYFLNQYPQFLKNNIDIIHITGQQQFKHIYSQSSYHSTISNQNESYQYSTYKDIKNQTSITILDYFTDMHHLYKWCNVAICRSGATSISELFIYKKPAILIPYPHSSDNHQELNAQAFCKYGYGLYTLEHNLVKENIIINLQTLKNKAVSQPSFTKSTKPNIKKVIDQYIS